MKTFLTQGSGNLITVHDGQAYVQQEDAGSISPGGLDSLAAVEDNLNLMAEQTQHIFLRAAQLLGVAPEKCCVIEDSKPGVAAGLAAGMQVIAITNTHPAAELRAATRVAQSYEEIGRLLIG